MLSFFPRGVLDEILNLIESVSVGFPTYNSQPLPATNLCCAVENKLLVVIWSTIVSLIILSSNFPGTDVKFIGP